MRRVITLFAAVVCLAGCDDHGPPAKAYRSWKNQLIVAAGLGDFFWPCYRKEKSAGLPGYGRIPLDQCFKMDPPRRWRGLWFNEFEGSRFCPAPAPTCGNDTPGDRIDLDWSFSFPPKWKGPPGGLYAVDFVGRRTAVKGRYGMGLSDYALVGDRLISMRQIKAPPTK